MTVVGVHEVDDYLAEFGTLFVSDDKAHEERGPFGRLNTTVQPSGTFVRTGHGWLEGSAGDGSHVVRMEVHDAAPEDDFSAWEDVAEIPYRCLSGTVGLGYVTGGFCGDVFPLPAAGAYRVRATRRQLGEDEMDDLWLLRFWPAEPSPPQWFLRRDVAVRPPGPGWSTLFGYAVTDLLFALWAARDETGGTTTAALLRWGAQHMRSPAWLDKPLPAPNHHELDPADVARQVGCPAPTTLGGMLDLFVAAGVLVDDGGYREPAVTPNPEDVLDLPEKRRAALIGQRAHDRFCSFAADLVSVAMWGGTEQTLASLAERTLVPQEDVRATLEWAARRGLLRIAGPLDGQFVTEVGPSTG
jgi:hypothetical protein